MFPSRFMPCPDCGESLERSTAALHRCAKDRELDYQMFRLRNEVDGTTDRAEWFPLAEVRELQRVKLVDIALEMAGLV